MKKILEDRCREAVECIDSCNMNTIQATEYLKNMVVDMMESALTSSKFQSLSLDDEEDRELFVHRLARVKAF